MILRSFLLCFIFCVSGAAAFAQTGKTPIIIIPGITGSSLINKETGENVWFTFKRAENDDLRLPMSSNLRANVDNIVAQDILREVKIPLLPDIQVYQGSLTALQTKGYAEGDWNNPQDADVYYVFAYDWRRDGVESAQNLINKIEELKAKLNKPELKFNVVAHSMGGLIARYAAMYGAQDLPANGKIGKPLWTGAKHFNKIMLFGSPNDGSFSAFTVLIEGYTIAGRNLPFVDDLSRDEIFSLPSLYQLMPHTGTPGFLDENLKPLRVDLYSVATWKKYGWGALSSPRFLAKLKDAARIPNVKPNENQKIKSVDDKLLSELTYAQAQNYLQTVLRRARHFQTALDADATPPMPIYAYGSECAPTLDGVVLLRNKKKNEWRTLTAPVAYKTSTGKKIDKKTLETAIFSVGDGRVPRRSLLRETKIKGKDGKEVVKSGLASTSTFFFCADHQNLLNNEAIQTKFLAELVADK